MRPRGDQNLTLGGCLGTGDSDNITGTAKPDFIEGAGGNDNINARAGSDDVIGNGGEDTIHGRSRGDILVGGFHSDVIFGEGGGDVMEDGPISQAGGGNNQYFGGPGEDTIFADNSFDPRPFAPPEVETVSGGPGNDLIQADDIVPVQDNIDCGSGFDSVNADPVDLINGVRADSQLPPIGDCEDVFGF